GGSLGFRINTSDALVDVPLTLGNQTVSIHFTASEVANGNGAFIAVFGGGVKVKIADFVEVQSTNFAISGNTAGGAGLALFIGQGPAYLDDNNSTVNPAARGLLLTGATVGVLKVPGTGNNPDTYAFVASGATLAIVGIPAVTIAATGVSVAFNNTGAAQDTTITFGSNQTVQVQFATADAVATVTVGTATLTALGQSLVGGFTFSQ